MNSRLYHILFLLVSVCFSIDALAQNTLSEKDYERATQILNELIPNERYFVIESGVRDKDFGMIIDFSVNKQLDKPVIIIDEDSSKFELCCFSGMEEDENGIINELYYSTSFLFSPNQLDKIKELKGILDKVF